MVDLNKITNSQDFQRLVNHLFSLECNSPDFLPFSPYIGKDSGFDAFFKGYYPPENLSGKFLIDAKYTKKNLDNAKKHLENEIKKKVIPNAIKNRIDHIRIATNAELRQEHVAALESLKNKKILSLRVWYGENLKLRIEKQPFLRNFYFGYPQYPLLIPSQPYFVDLEKQLTRIPCTKIDAFKEYISDFKNFIASNDDRLFVIHAPGGFGKSHLLREIAAMSLRLDPERQPWMIKAGYRSLEAAIQDEIISDRKYLLILDDADRNLTILYNLLPFITKSGVDVKVILGLRTSGIYLLNEAIRELRCSEITKITRIKEWTTADLTKLLRITAGKKKVKDEEIIINDLPNPYFIVLIGRKMKGVKILDFSKVKSKIIEDIVTDARRCLTGILNKEIEDLLLMLACITPFNIEDHTTIEQLGNNINKDSNTIKEVLKRLLENNILRQIGKSVRFAPDMRGDIYLLYKVGQLDKEYFKKIILEWMPKFSKNIFVNLGATFRYGEVSIISSILKEFINEWVEKAASTVGSDRNERLEWLQNVVAFDPQGCVNLVNSYLDTVTPQEASFLDPDKYKTLNLNTDDYGPIIIGLIRNLPEREPIINLIEKIFDLGIGGTYDNYKPLTLIKECVSPLRNNSNIIIETLNITEKWLDAPNKKRADMLVAALCEILAATHEYTRSYLDKMEFGERALQNIPQVISIRERSMQVLIKMLSSNNIDLKLSAIDIIENIGRTRMGSLSPSSLPLAERFTCERRTALQEISRLINKDAEYLLLSKIEDLLLHFWAQQIVGAEEAQNLLLRFSNDPEYKLFRFFASELDIFMPFQEIAALAPESNRWHWVVDNIMSRKWKMTAKDFLKPIESLNGKYNTAETIAEFLIKFWGKISILNIHQSPIFINCWVQLNKNAFNKIRIENELWSQIPERFKMAVDIALYDLNEEHIQRVAAEIFEGALGMPNERINTFLVLMEIKPPKQWKEWLHDLILKGNQQSRKALIRSLYFIYKKDQDANSILELLLLVIEKIELVTREVADDVAFIIHSLNNELRVLPDVDKLYSALLNMIKDSPKLEWHDQEIIEFCIENIDGLLTFIEYRLSKSKALADRSEFEAIPYEGIKQINKAIKAYEEYKKFTLKAIEWYEKFSKGIEHYDVEKILKQILLIREEATKNLFFFTLFKELSQNNSIDKILICAQYLPLNQETKEIFVEIAIQGIKDNKNDNIRSLLFSKTIPENGWSSSVGQVPPALQEKKRIYEDILSSSAPGYLRNLIIKCISSIDSSIKDHMDRDKEFLSDRS